RSRCSRPRTSCSGVRLKLGSSVAASSPSDKRHRFHQAERCRSWHALTVTRVSHARQSVGQLPGRYCRSILRKISCSASSASETHCSILEIHVIPAKLQIAGARGNRKNKLTWVPQE